MGDTTGETSPPRDRRSWSWLVLLGPVVVLVASLTGSYLWNEDFWWYVSSGRAILEQGGIPEEDPFLYTPNEVGWVYHSWLWTVLVAALEQLGGLEAVVVLHVVAAVLLSIVVYTTARVDRYGLVNALMVLLFLLTVRHRLCGKAEVATWLMLALFFRILERPGGFTWRKGALLGGLTLLWANLHGGYPLAIFITLCYAVGARLPGAFARRGRSRDGTARAPAAEPPPLWFPLVLFAVAVADPRMFRERLAPFGFVLGSESVQPKGELGSYLILEWRSPFDSTLDAPELVWLYLAAAVLGLGSFLVTRYRHLPRLLFLLGMAALAYTAVRHLGGLGLAAALVAIRNAGERPAAAEVPKRSRRATARPGRRRLLYAGGAVLAGLVLLASAVGLRVARSGFDSGVAGSGGRFFTTNPAIAAPAAAEFVRRHRLPGPIFNDYQLGAYLGARLAPEHRVFIDSRVLDPRTVERYTRMVQSEDQWRSSERRYGFRTVVLGHFSKTLDAPLGSALVRDPRWRLGYVGPAAAVFVRDGPRGETETRLRGDAGAPPFLSPAALSWPLELLQRAFLGRTAEIYLVEYLANLGRLGRLDEVRQLATHALEAAPGHPLVLRQRCAARLAQGQVEPALADCEDAYMRRPDDSQIAALYVVVLRRAGQPVRATAVLLAALERDPDDPMLHGLLRDRS